MAKMKFTTSTYSRNFFLNMSAGSSSFLLKFHYNFVMIKLKPFIGNQIMDCDFTETNLQSIVL